MRWTPTIAAALLAASAAEAQVGCRGDTLSELNECATAARPEPVEPSGGLVRNPSTRPADLGGALQPTDLRATPPVARTRNVQPSLGQVLTEDAQELASPESFGLARDGVSDFYEVDGSVVRVNRATREILEILPTDGTVAASDRLVPGSIDY